jgi:hypothetical protein
VSFELALSTKVSWYWIDWSLPRGVDYQFRRRLEAARPRMWTVTPQNFGKQKKRHFCHLSKKLESTKTFIFKNLVLSILNKWVWDLCEVTLNLKQ